MVGFQLANLSIKPTGGYLGMPPYHDYADMRVVDIYRRGNKLAENWVFIDLLHFLNMQGKDILSRYRLLTGYSVLYCKSHQKVLFELSCDCFHCTNCVNIMLSSCIFTGKQIAKISSCKAAD